MFIRILLEKKYALPYQVLDALVAHFNRFRYDKRQMPVLWHQSLLVFCQRYKDDITEEQSDLLFELVKIQHHALITPEIRRECTLFPLIIVSIITKTQLQSSELIKESRRRDGRARSGIGRCRDAVKARACVALKIEDWEKTFDRIFSAFIPGCLFRRSPLGPLSKRNAGCR